MATDPWADIREQMDMIRFANPAARPFDAGLVWNLLSDADALLAVKEATRALSLDIHESFPEGLEDLGGVGPYIDEIDKALAALPERLR